MYENNKKTKEIYDRHSKLLVDLNPGDIVLCQNTRNNKWDREGIVVEKSLDNML